MPDLSKQINSYLQALIDGNFGCLDAAVETINARLGGAVGKGTLSKRFGGALAWPVTDIIALEDAAGKYPVTRMMARRLASDNSTARGSIFQHAGLCAKETGEAVHAILSAQSSGSPAEAIAEIDEAMEALRQARKILEAQG